MIANGIIHEPLRADDKTFPDFVQSLRGDDLLSYQGCADRVAAETGIHP